MKPVADQPESEVTRYRFGDCVLEPTSRVLRRGDEVVAVQAQVFDLIHFLVRHANTVISRHTLLEQVWGNTHLTDASITQSVRKARQAVGDDGTRQQVIRTVHGQGFCFVADVAMECVEPRLLVAHEAVDRQTRQRRVHPSWWVVVAALVVLAGVGWQHSESLPAAGTAPVSIAVFPFSNQTDDPDMDWLQRGLADTVGILLDQSDIDVRITLDQAGAFADVPPGDQQTDDEKLAARTAIMGTDFGLVAAVSAQSNRFVVDWRIARADGGVVRGSFGSVSATTVSRQLVEQVLAAINRQSKMSVANIAMLKDPLALELYARGTEALYQDQREQAVALLTAAQARAPDLPQLQVAVAVAGFDPGDVEASLSRYRDSLAALPEDASQARTQLEYEIGTRSWFAGAIHEAADLLQHVVDSTTSGEKLHASALNGLSLVLQSQSRYDEAWERARQAEMLFRDMDNPYQLSMVLTNLGYMAEDLGRLREAGEHHQSALDIRRRYRFPSLIAASQYGLARIERRRGNFDVANELLTQSLHTVRGLKLPFDTFDNLEELAELRMRQGRFDDARDALLEARALAISSDDSLGVAWADEVMVRFKMRTGGMDDTTVQQMQSAIQAFEDMGELENLSTAKLELAALFVEMGDVARATDALKEFGGDGHFANPVLSIRWQSLSGELALLGDDRAGAIQLLTTAMRSARNTGVMDLEAELALRLGQLALEDGDLATTRRLLAVAEAWSKDYYRTRELSSALMAAVTDGSLSQ